MQKPRRDDKKKGRRRNKGYDSDEEPDLIDPQVYLNFACSSDMSPTELFECVGVEWGRMGGAKVYLKAFSSFDTETGAMCLRSWNRLHHQTFKSEFILMFEEAKELMFNQGLQNGEPWGGYDRPILEFHVRLMNPKLIGQDTSQFSGWPTSKQFKRKAIHLEMEVAAMEHVHEVVNVMKAAGIVRKYWGKNAHLTNIIVKDSNNRIVLQAGELKALSAMARDHVNFQASMTSDVLSGVEDLDKSFTFNDVTNQERAAGQATLRHILYNYVFMPDGHSLFVEIHRSSPVANVEVIIPNIQVAKDMLDEINKCPPAYLYYYLQEHHIPEEFLVRLIGGSMDPILCQQIQACKWDAEKKTLKMPDDGERAVAKSMSEAAWYNDEFGEHMNNEKQRKAPEEFASEEFMYNHDYP